MKQLVVDSSVIIKWFNDEEGSEEAGKILEEIRTGQTVVYCPELANRAARLAVSRKITYYDTVFEALAKGRKIRLTTANPKHQKGMY